MGRRTLDVAGMEAMADCRRQQIEDGLVPWVERVLDACEVLMASGRLRAKNACEIEVLLPLWMRLVGAWKTRTDERDKAYFLLLNRHGRKRGWPRVWDCVGCIIFTRPDTPSGRFRDHMHEKYGGRGA